MFAGLSCHSCNSIYDRRCGDPYDAYTTEIVDCEQVNTIRFGVGIFFILLRDIGEHFKTCRPPSIFCLKSWLLLNWWYFCHRSGGSWPMSMELRALQHFVERQCRQVQFLILPQLLGIISCRELGPFEQLENGVTFSGWWSARSPFLWLRP